MSFNCEICGSPTTYGEASLIAIVRLPNGRVPANCMSIELDKYGPRGWAVGCCACSTECRYWIDLRRLEGCGSVEAWLDHLEHKRWFGGNVGASMFRAAADRALSLKPRASRTPKRPRTPLSPGVRFAVLERDGFRCRYCGRTADEVKLHVDHVKSLRDGGTDDLGNLAAACADCNHGKGARSMPQAGAR